MLHAIGGVWRMDLPILVMGAAPVRDSDEPNPLRPSGNGHGLA